MGYHQRFISSGENPPMGPPVEAHYVDAWFEKDDRSAIIHAYDLGADFEAEYGGRVLWRMINREGIEYSALCNDYTHPPEQGSRPELTQGRAPGVWKHDDLSLRWMRVTVH